MTAFRPFALAPLWRPVCAVAVGICCAGSLAGVCVATAVAVLLLVWTFKGRYGLGKDIRVAILYTYAFFAFGLGLGYFRSFEMPRPADGEERDYHCEVVTEPYFKGKTYRCAVKLLASMDSMQVVKNSKAILYLADTSTHCQLERGDLIYVRTALALPAYNKGYADYLLRNGFCGTGYVPAGNLLVAGHAPFSSLLDVAAHLRDKVYEWYRRLGFEKDELAVLAALTLGTKDRMDDELKADFTVAGVSHVLALSGLHVGLIFCFITLVLKPLRKYRFGRLAEWVITSFALVSFAFLTGLSPSVVRACCMMSALSLGRALGREGASANTLFAVALCMLVYEPYYIYNVGFLMSFAAVLAILLFFRPVAGMFPAKGKVARYVRDLFVVSLVAQVGVMPITLASFGSFSLVGIIASVIVVPMLSVVLFLAVIMVALAWCAPVASVLAACVERAIGLMTAVVRLLSDIPSAQLSGIACTQTDALLLYLVSVTFLVWLICKNPRIFRLLFAEACVCLAIHIGKLYQERNTCELRFHNTVAGTQCVFKDQFAEHTFVGTTDTLCMGNRFWQKGNMAYFNGKFVMKIASPTYELPLSTSKHPVDYLWVSKGTKGNLEEIFGTYIVDTVLLDASLSRYQAVRYSQEAESVGIPCVDLGRTDVWTVEF